MKTNKKFIIYSKDGFAESPSGENMENLQVLGWSNGKDAEDALEKFKVKESQAYNDLIEKGYKHFTLQEIVGDQESFL